MPKDINSGRIKNESDFEKIKEDIEEDKLKDAQQFLSYTYINNDNVQEFTSIEELAKNFFVDNYNEEIWDGDLHCTDMYYYSKDLKKVKKEM